MSTAASASLIMEMGTVSRLLEGQGPAWFDKSLSRNAAQEKHAAQEKTEARCHKRGRTRETEARCHRRGRARETEARCHRRGRTRETEASPRKLQCNTVANSAWRALPRASSPAFSTSRRAESSRVERGANTGHLRGPRGTPLGPVWSADALQTPPIGAPCDPSRRPVLAPRSTRLDSARQEVLNAGDDAPGNGRQAEFATALHWSVLGLVQGVDLESSSVTL